MTTHLGHGISSTQKNSTSVKIWGSVFLLEKMEINVKPVIHGSTFVDQQMLLLLFTKLINVEQCVMPC